MRQRFEHKTITILSNKSLPQYCPKVAARITLEIGTSTCACVRAYLWWKWPPAQNQCVSSDIWVSVLIKLTVCAIAKWCSRCANSWLCVLCHVIYTNRYICSGRIQTVTQAHTLTLVPLLSMLYSVHTLTHNAVVQLSITCTYIFLSNFGQQAKPCSGQRSQEQPPHQRHTTTTTPTSTPVANVCVCRSHMHNECNYCNAVRAACAMTRCPSCVRMHGGSTHIYRKPTSPLPYHWSYAETVRRCHWFFFLLLDSIMLVVSYSDNNLFLNIIWTKWM